MQSFTQVKYISKVLLTKCSEIIKSNTLIMQNDPYQFSRDFKF